MVPSASKISPTTALTIEAWIYPTAYDGNGSAIVTKNFQTSFWLGYSSTGRVYFYPKGGSGVFLNSRGATLIQLNRWTHIAGTYDGTTTRIIINGVQDTSTTAITGPIGTNTDSLLIGAESAGSLFINYHGYMDDVRLWSVARPIADVARDRYIPLAPSRETGGVYNGIVAAWRMNGNPNDDAGNLFNDGVGRNMSWLDLRQKGANNVDYNSTLIVDGTNGYCAAVPDPAFDATTAITLEAWVKRDTTGTQNAFESIINKGGGTTRFNYALYINSGNGLVFDFNDGAANLIAGNAVATSRWTHVAGTYNSATGRATLYVNGDSVASTIFSGNPAILNNPDSAYVGTFGASSFAAYKWKGQIDEVRIWKNVVRTASEIKSNMYQSIDFATSPLPTNVVVWGFDGKNSDEMVNLASSFPAREIHFKGNARLTSSLLQNNAELTSPLLRDDAGGFGGLTYKVNTRRFWIPDNVPAGVLDSVYVSAGGTASGVKVFVLMNHTWISDITVDLTGPTGVTVALLGTGVGGSYNDLMTIFTDAADSLPGFSTTGLYAPFSPLVKPVNALSAFIGVPRQGWWKMKFADNAAADIGYVSGWGVQTSPLVDVPILAGRPEKFELAQNYPNPFNPSTSIKFTIPRQVGVSLKIYDILGREVATLLDEVKAPGTYSVTWDASALASGVYFYRIKAGDFMQAKKMMLVK